MSATDIDNLYDVLNGVQPIAVIMTDSLKHMHLGSYRSRCKLRV